MNNILLLRQISETGGHPILMAAILHSVFLDRPATTYIFLKILKIHQKLNSYLFF